MALQEQAVSFPIVGGVDEDAHPRLSVRPLVMENCRQFEAGAIGKRYGTNCVGRFNARFGGGTPPAGELLCSYGNELVRVGEGQVDTVKAIASTDCIFKGRASEALVYRTSLTSGESYVAGVDVAVGNGLTIYFCHALKRDASTGLDSELVAYVLDSDGAVLVSRRVIESGNSSIAYPHVTVIGNIAIFVWLSGTAIKANTLDLTTISFGTASTIVAGPVANAGGFAVGVLSDRFAVLYEDATGVMVGTWNSSLAVVTAAVNVANNLGITAFAVEGITGQTLYIGYSLVVGGSLYVRRACRNPATLAQTVAVGDIDSYVTATKSVINIGIAVTSTGSPAYYTWSTVDSSSSIVETQWATVTSAGTIGTIRQTYQVILSSKPFLSLGNLYALVRSYHSTHASYFLVHLNNSVTPATTDGMRMVATIAPRQVPRMLTAYERGSLSNCPIVSSGKYAIAAAVSGTLVDSMAAALLDVRIGATLPVSAEAGKTLVMSGGCPSAYDGSNVAELGFAWEPDSSRMSTVVSAGGNLTASSTYRYLAVYEWRFGNGAVVRSIPSYPFAFNADDQSTLITAVTTAPNKTVTVRITHANITNKQTYSSYAGAIVVVVYRTLAGGSTFYRLTDAQPPLVNLSRPMNGSVFDVVDALADTELATHSLLYTSGGALPSEIPPSSGHVAVIGNRVWLSNTEDDAIWFSNMIVDGEAPTFSGSLTIAPFEGGRVVGMAKLDEKKIVLKENSIYFLIGDGPGIDGLNGTFSSPISIPCDVGCTDRRSIVSTPVGVLFMSQNGLAMIGRDLSVTLVGKAVVDTVAANPIVAASVVPDQDVVRIVVGGGMRTVEFDLFHGGAWGTNTYSDPASGGAPTIVGATYCRGSWWHLTSEGKVFQELKTSWLDVNGASTGYPVMRARLRYLSLGDIQGFARCWYVSVNGETKSPHDLTMKLYIDENSSFTQTSVFTALTISAWSRYQAQLHVVQQQCEAISVEVSDGTPTGVALGTGQGFVLFGVSAEVGLEKAFRRVPAAQSK